MKELAQAVAVTAELTGTELSEAAAAAMVEVLAGYERAHVLGALRRCMRELKGRLTIAAVLERLDDGRPGPEEAWAMLPAGEADSVVWTDEMAEAFGVALPLLEAGDKVAARMAFKEAYTARVSKARDQRKPANWTASLGHDARGRDGVLQEAVRVGRLSLEHARTLSPMLPAPNADVLEAIGYGKRVTA